MKKKYPRSVISFVGEIKSMHEKWEKQHDYDEGMRGGYGNPLLAVDLLERICEMIK